MPCFASHLASVFFLWAGNIAVYSSRPVLPTRVSHDPCTQLHALHQRTLQEPCRPFDEGEERKKHGLPASVRRPCRTKGERKPSRRLRESNLNLAVQAVSADSMPPRDSAVPPRAWRSPNEAKRARGVEGARDGSTTTTSTRISGVGRESVAQSMRDSLSFPKKVRPVAQ